MNADEKFARLMKIIATNYNQNLNDDKISLYKMLAKKYGVDTFYDACMSYMSSEDGVYTMPNIASVAKHVNGKESDKKLALEDKAQTQWQTVMRAISECGSYRTPTFKDSVTTAVICAMGNWSYLCSLTNEQLVWAGKEFVNHYRSYSTRPIQELPNHVQGLIDRGGQASTLGELINKLGASNE